MASVKQVVCGFIVLFSVFLTVVSAGKSAYIVHDLLQSYECVPLSMKNISCAGDKKVLAQGLQNLTFALEQTSKGMGNLLKQNLINQTCFDGVIEATCSGIPDCTPEKIRFDVEAAVAVCEKGKAQCPESIAKYVLNCTAKREIYDIIKAFIRPLPTCEEVKDSNGTCPDTKYKLPQYAGLEYAELFKGLRVRLEAMKPNITSSCYEEVKKTGCLLITRPCSDDEKHLVSLISEQDCLSSLKCVEGMGKGFNISDVCSELPDAKTAKKVVAPDDGTNGASFIAQGMPLVFTALLYSSILLFI